MGEGGRERRGGESISKLLQPAHLVSGSGVAKETRCEVRDVTGYLLDHKLPHLAVPDSFWSVKLTKEGLTELLSTCSKHSR